MGESPGPSAIGWGGVELLARACVELFLILGAIRRHFPRISSFPPPYYPEICAEDDTEG